MIISHISNLVKYTGKLSLVLCDDLVMWDRGVEGVQEGGDICMLMTDSHCCMAENSTTL